MDTTRTRMQLKGCHRCGGDLYMDEAELQFSCLQCGRSVPLNNAAFISRQGDVNRQAVVADRTLTESRRAA